MDSSVTVWSAVSSAQLWRTRLSTWIISANSVAVTATNAAAASATDVGALGQLNISADLAYVPPLTEYWKTANSQGHNFRYINFHVSNLTPTLIFITLPCPDAWISIYLQNRSTTADCWFVFIRYWWPLIIQRNSPGILLLGPECSVGAEAQGGR